VTLSELTLPTFNLVRSFSFVGDPSYGLDGGEVAKPPERAEAAKPKAKRRKKARR
jgi:hypothetical protein